jgi:hypothetical protein
VNRLKNLTSCKAISSWRRGSSARIAGMLKKSCSGEGLRSVYMPDFMTYIFFSGSRRTSGRAYLASRPVSLIAFLIFTEYSSYECPRVFEVFVL